MGIPTKNCRKRKLRAKRRRRSYLSDGGNILSPLWLKNSLEMFLYCKLEELTRLLRLNTIRNKAEYYLSFSLKSYRKTFWTLQMVKSKAKESFNRRLVFYMELTKILLPENCTLNWPDRPCTLLKKINRSDSSHWLKMSYWNNMCEIDVPKDNRYVALLLSW